MIRSKFTVHCDLCGAQRGPTFCSEYHADSWIEDRDEDYEEYGQFADGVTPRRSTFFHKAGHRVICPSCVEIEIERMKRRNDRLVSNLQTIDGVVPT